MHETDSENVQTKASSEIFFSEFGKNVPDDEEPTTENNRVIDLYDPVDAMSLNRERDRVVVSGIRGVLQIIKILNSKNSMAEKPAIIKDLDMRVYRKGKVNILYSAQNVKWNQLYDQYIATTSSNGSVVCWNVSRKNKSVYKSHERSATCLDWHATTPYILISGSRDCSVKSYDMRVKDTHQLCFTDRNCESIRDVAMCKAPGLDDYFFTGDDGGVLRLWDLRQTKRWVFQKVAHRSFVSTLAMNPHKRTMIATGGGRDKMVKIWDWNGPDLNRIAVVETTAPLGRVVWRPDKPFHLATCASVNETTVHVWDVRRPYLPYVTYDEHRDSVTDACWPSNDSDVFLTCGKDGVVVLHNIDSGHAPISFACDVAFDITPDGTIGLAVNSEIHAKNDAELEASIAKPTKDGKKAIRQMQYETFEKPVKSLVAFGVPEALTHSLPPTTFYKIAEKYVIGGLEIMQLCEKNSKIARKHGLEHVAQTWRLVEALCEQAKLQEEYARLSIEEKQRVIRAWAVRRKELAEEGRRWLANLNDLYKDEVKRQVTQRLESTQHVTAFLRFSSSEDSDEEDPESFNKIEEVDRMAPSFAQKKKKKRKKKGASDFYFGAGEANFKGGREEALHHNEFIGLRDEAYEIRDVEAEKKFFCKAKPQPTTSEEYEILKREFEQNEYEFQAWSPMIEIFRLLLYHAEQGDMQTCATITMVCGKRLLDAVDFYTVNGWITCYMEMLDSLELYNVIAKIRKYCTLESINSVSRENTLIQLAHSSCDALIVNGRCNKCEQVSRADCTVCRFAIVGMTYQCNVCGHCMHVDHAYEWFQHSTTCAFVGCPCTCGDNTWPDMERTFIGNDEIVRDHRKFEREDESEEDDEDEKPIDNRADASRLDTSSEESDREDLEWSVGNKKILEKFGELPSENWDTPWAKFLVELHTTRTKMAGKRKKEDPPEEDSDDEDKPREESPKTQKESKLREAFMYDIQEECEQLKEIIPDSKASDKEEKPVMDVDRTELIYDYLFYSEDYDEDEGQFEEYEEQDELYPRTRLEIIEEEDETEGETDRESCFTLGVFPPDDIDPREKRITRHLLKVKCPSSLYGNDYIKSIAPIGFFRKSEKLKDVNYFDKELPENERVTSPKLTSAVKTFLENVKRQTFGGSSEDEMGEESDDDDREMRKLQYEEWQKTEIPAEKEEEEVVKEEEVKKKETKKKKTNYAEKALKILSMTRDELKSKKKKKDKKRINKIYDSVFCGKEASSDISSDEFVLSSSLSSSDPSFLQSPVQSDISSPSTSSESNEESSSDSSDSELLTPQSEDVAVKIDEGYEAESEDISDGSASNDDLSDEPALHQPTPQANGDLKPQTPPQKFALKRTKKVSKTGKVLEYFFEVDETNRPPSPPWVPNPCSSDSDSCPSSHSSPSPPPEPPKKEEEPVKKVEEGEYVPWYEQVSDDDDSREPVPLSPLVPKKIDWEETSIPVIVEPVTSCANPIFSRITGRPPRTRPISISGYDRIIVTNGHGSPSRTAGAAANPMFQCSSSLPTIIDSSNLPPEEEIQSDDVEVSPAVAEANAKYSNWGDRIKPMSQLLNGVPKLNGVETEKTQERPEKQPESSESELFSSEDEDPLTMSARKDEEPFFPACEDVPRKSRGHRHPWETEKQYQRRLLKEQEEEDADEAEREKIRQAEEEVRRKKEEEEREWAERLTKHTPIMQELARRKRRAQYKFKMPLPSSQRPGPLPSLKRVRFTEKELDENLRAALESLKPELYLSDDSEYKKFVREKKVCKACKAQDVRHTRQEKDYVKWMRHVADEGQIFFARSLTDSCSVFQLAYLDGYTTDVDRVKQTALHLTEFIKMFYFINWEEMLLPYNDLVLKEVYELWDEFHQRRPRVCRLHYRDYQFKFFASSIATKIKAHLSRSDPISVRRKILSYDWLHLKPCVTTLDDDLTTIEEMLDPAVKHNPNWSLEEKKAANQYWDMFGNVPLHMKTTGRIMLPPESEDLLEIVDDSNYFTKKMIKNAIYNSRKYDIRLQYTTRKKKPDLFYVQDRSRRILNREWQMRLDRMINETRHVDFSSSSFHLNPQNKLIYAADPKHPFPVCQFDMGKHLVTVQPMVSKRYEALKSRLRRKFQFRRGTKCHGVSKHIELTTDKIRKLPSYKKFEPKLQKAEDFNKMLSKHLKVVDRVYPYSIRHLETIIEEDDETYLMVQMLEAQNAEEGNEYIDPESIFTMRRLTRSKEDRINQNQYYDEEYRRQLMNTEKLEKEKMRIVKKQWLPEFRKKLRVARKAIEVGRLMVEEDVRKWMSYQFELSFSKKQYRKNSWITRKQLLAATAPHWHEAIENLDFKDPAPPPVYSKPLPPLNRPEPSDGWNFNSSSDSGDYDSDDTDKEDDSFNDYETQPDLLAVAGELQVDLRAKIEEADQMADEEWEYSDDSSVSTWFDNDSDDILNRLINPDYMEENMMIKERMKGALGKKLWEIEQERATPEPVSDDELIDEREKEEEEEEEILQENMEVEDIGDSDGVRRNQMTHLEEDVFTEKYLKREDRDEEMQQVRLFFKQFRIDHTYTSEPYKWSDELHDAFSCMHRNELRRVGNRLHRKIKDEYEKEADMDNVIADVIPLDENGLQYKLINFLLFREEGESFKESSAKADECNEFLRPIQRYEMFFGREGTYHLATFAEEILQMKDLRASFYCLMRHFGTNWKLPVKPVQKFIKLWWYNSRETLERFIFNFGEKVQTQKEIRRAVRKGCATADEMGFNIRSIRHCFDKLEIASLVNDMIQEVHEYVEETTALCTDDSLTELDRQAFAVMDTLHFMQMKKGFPRDKHLVKRTDKTNRLDMYASSDSDTENPFEMMMLEAESRKLYLSPYKPRDRWKSSNSEEAETFSQRKMTPDQMEHYSKLYVEMKAKEAEKRRRRDEEAARGTLLRWEQVEREQRWLVEDMERKVHDYIMKQIAIKEIEGPGIEDPCVMYYGREGIHKTEVLDMCGLPLNLDNQMFYLEFEECQSGNSSISDASELAEVIEKGFDDIDDDAKSYSSVKHVLKHELHFQTEVESRRVPSCVIIFTPDQFFTNQCDDNQEYERWRRIIEASECPFSFNRLVMRERMLQRCRDEFQTALIEKYFDPNERIYQRFIEVFERCFILCVLDTELEAWDCRVISVDDHSAPASTRISYLRKKMVEDSQEHLTKWLEANIIDMDVYSRCPVILASHKDLTIKDANLISTIFMEEHIRDEWFLIRRDEGVKALDTIIRMPPPPAHKLPAYKIIFKPIYDAWIETWKFRNDQEGTQTLVIKKYDGVKEYIHKARMIVNYAHQYYRMKRFDSKMSKDPTEYQMIDRSDVPSASLFDSLDTAVSKFCNEDSPHLNDVDKQSVKDTLIQLATGKIPYFTANYLGGYDYSETNELNADDDENDDDRLPNMINPTTTDILPSLPGEEDVPEMEDVEEEYKWLRNLYNDSDFNRRRFMAVLLFEIAQRAVFKYAPHLADFERARKRFDYLLTLHGRQRPLLDMMLTKVRGTYFMPKDTNVFLYKQKLITFDELLDSAIHPKVWKDRKITLEDFRRQAPKDPYDLKAFIAWNGEDDDSDLESIADSDTSSSLSDSSGGSSSSSKTAKRIRRSLNRIRRELMITRLRSKPSNPEEAFALERRAIGPKMWKRRRQINEMVELIADMDRNKIEEKIPAKKKELLNYINDLIVDNAETAHWSWGELKMRTKIGKIPPPIAMRPKHIRRIRKGLTAYKDPVEYDPKDPRTNGRRYFS